MLCETLSSGSVPRGRQAARQPARQLTAEKRICSSTSNGCTLILSNRDEPTSMPEVLPGFIKITDVPREYQTSRKTIERRRDKARDAGDAAVYRMFKLRTKDG